MGLPTIIVRDIAFSVKKKSVRLFSGNRLWLKHGHTLLTGINFPDS